MNIKFITMLMVCIFFLNPSFGQTVDLDPQIHQAEKNQDTTLVIDLVLKKINYKDLDNTPTRRLDANNWIFNYVLKKCDQKRDLNRAADYLQYLISLSPHSDRGAMTFYAGFIDTYANLLYKAGKRKQAIKEEMRAMEFAHEDQRPEFTAVLEKMKLRLPTW